MEGDKKIWRGAVLEQEGVTAHPFIQLLPNQSALVDRLRTSLIQQAEPVVTICFPVENIARVAP
jgi:hypothetical protein